ncbi:single-stranded DNA-binding protein [uncultured Cutibacterium sp.]|uniref:single-stranded DNA-binding protein n=1 Tax=uncultured Cutibacterium sp. TaxID=1912223 RepID=UPI0020585756|nr:single-stranded DNA-binding protein [uncultured Cutibacterium sp.]MDU1580845.1 single-stranded DNA-binding protein [Cutibacterium granulosum]DAT57869.1 MAG TPA: Single stranded DNA binding protein [Caudoviricetes sp.]
MSGETSITIVGNLTADPELKFTQSGIPAANFTVASTPRTFDKQSNQWVDGDPLFLRCTVWRDHAEHVAESLSKGMRVIVQGNLRANQWTDKQGNRRTTYQIDVAEIGPSLRYATAQVSKAGRGSNFGQSQGDHPAAGGAGMWTQPQTGWQQPSTGQAPF